MTLSQRLNVSTFDSIILNVLWLRLDVYDVKDILVVNFGQLCFFFLHKCSSFTPIKGCFTEWLSPWCNWEICWIPGNSFNQLHKSQYSSGSNTVLYLPLTGHFWVFSFLFRFSGSQPSWLGSVWRLSKTHHYFRPSSLKIIPQESLKTIPELRTGNIAPGVQEHSIIWWNWSLDVLVSICFQFCVYILFLLLSSGWKHQ